MLCTQFGPAKKMGAKGREVKAASFSTVPHKSRYIAQDVGLPNLAVITRHV